MYKNIYVYSYIYKSKNFVIEKSYSVAECRCEYKRKLCFFIMIYFQFQAYTIEMEAIHRRHDLQIK